MDRLSTKRLVLVPYTMQICKSLLANNFENIFSMGFKKGKSWPDNDVMETLPKIINNLSHVEAPTGFESWMIIKNDTLEIIGDAGFKGFNNQTQTIDIGYGIIKEERRNGYAEESASALIKWAFTHEKVKQITATCLIDNMASIKLLQKLQFIEIKKSIESIDWYLVNNQ